MNIRTTLPTILAAALLAAGCATPATPVPQAVPGVEQQFTIDPRTGWSGTPAPGVERRFDEAWRFATRSQPVEARRRLDEILLKNPEYSPAALAQAVLELNAGNVDAASTMIGQIVEREPNYTAARVYEAEIATNRGDTRRALAVYRALVSLPSAPAFAQERVTSLEASLFNEAYTAAQSAPDADAIRLLNEALTINPGASNARVQLVQKLVARKSWDEARRALDPLLESSELDRPEVQEALAEIDAGRGRFQEAIVRYDRLARRTKEDRYTRRLGEIKEQWNAANLPSHVRRALESEAITRGDLATLIYWNVSAVRFAQNVGTPAIAIDIGDQAGRDEIVRAIAIGLYEVDPITRRVSPNRVVTTQNFERHIARLLSVRGAACARGVADADDVLAACNIPAVTAGTSGEAGISGHAAVRVLERVNAVTK